MVFPLQGGSVGGTAGSMGGRTGSPPAGLSKGARALVSPSSSFNWDTLTARW